MRDRHGMNWIKGRNNVVFAFIQSIGRGVIVEIWDTAEYGRFEISGV
jgi:hypothetical protein